MSARPESFTLSPATRGRTSKIYSYRIINDLALEVSGFVSEQEIASNNITIRWDNLRTAYPGNSRWDYICLIATYGMKRTCEKEAQANLIPEETYLATKKKKRGPTGECSM